MKYELDCIGDVPAGFVLPHPATELTTDARDIETARTAHSGGPVWYVANGSRTEARVADHRRDHQRQPGRAIARSRPEVIAGVLIFNEKPLLCDLSVTPMAHFNKPCIQRLALSGRRDFENGRVSTVKRRRRAS